MTPLRTIAMSNRLSRTCIPYHRGGPASGFATPIWHATAPVVHRHRESPPAVCTSTSTGGAASRILELTMPNEAEAGKPYERLSGWLHYRQPFDRVNQSHAGRGARPVGAQASEVRGDSDTGSSVVQP